MKYTRFFACLICILLVLLTSAPVNGNAEKIQHDTAELSQYKYQNYYKPENTNRYINYKKAYPAYSWEKVIIYVNIGLDNSFYKNVSAITKPAAVNVLVNKYHQLPSNYIPTDLETISAPYNASNVKLRSEAKAAFEQMCDDAAALGLNIRAVSGYRSYSTQDSIYYSKITQGSAASMAARDMFSARAGFSEHQLGLAIDVCMVADSIVNSDEYAWYSKNAYKYGFIIRYPSGKESITGYNFEPWHLRYLGVDLATVVYNSGLTYDEYYAKYIEAKDKYQIASAQSTDLTIDGSSYYLHTYNINGKIYTKLRDLAELLNGTQKQFNIVWQETENTVSIAPETPYSDQSGTPVAMGIKNSSPAFPSPSGINIGGRKVIEDIYTIDGNTYIRPEYLAQALDFQLTIDSDTIKIVTESNYAKQNQDSVQTAFSVLYTLPVNGVKVTLNLYEIDSNYYIWLRDLAQVVSDTDCQFSVGWDNAARAPVLTGKQPYTPVTGELSLSGAGTWTNAIPASPAVSFNGKPITAEAYTIHNNNYFRLNEMIQALNLSSVINVSQGSVEATVSAADPGNFKVENGVLLQYTGSEYNVTIPDYLGITSIGEEAFQGCAVKSVVLPDTITTISPNAFANCSWLSKITIPKSVQSIGDKAFWGCGSLTSITLPAGVKEIGKCAFAYSGLTAVSLPDSLKYVGTNAFLETALTTPLITGKGTILCFVPQNTEEYSVPQGITVISGGAFSGCKALTSVTLPDSLKSIGAYAFSGCSALTEITIPDSVTEIGAFAFNACTGINKLCLPASLQSIGNFVFNNCSKVISLLVPDGVSTIGDYAFSRCGKLAAIELPNSVTAVSDTAFAGCSSTFAIYGLDNSYAQQYAGLIGCPFVSGEPALRTELIFTVNGTLVPLASFLIDDEVYIGLRNLAAILNGTAKQFQVGYDSKNYAINIMSNQAYTPLGSELKASEANVFPAIGNASLVFLDGGPLSLTTYTIKDSTCFKLNDMAQALDLGIIYDKASHIINIDTR